MTIARIAAAGLAVVLLGRPARASDWPQYKRDSARSGDAAEETLRLPLQRVTAVRFPAPIYASPAVVAGRVYIQDGRGHVACVDAAANKVLWVTNLGGVNNLSSPAVAGGKVYVGSTAGCLAILDAAGGRILRKLPVEGEVIASPAVTDGAVYFSSTAAKLVKADLEGNVLWTYSGSLDSYNEIAVRGREILFVQANAPSEGYARLCVLLDEGKSAKLDRKFAPSYGGGPLCPTGGPTFGDEGLYGLQGFDSECGAFCIFSRAPVARKLDDKSAGILWRTSGELLRWNASRVTASFRAGRFHRGDICFSAEGYFWRADPEALVSGGSQSSPALAKDLLAVGSDAGKLWFFPVEPPGGAEPARDPKAARIQKPAWSYAALGAGKPNGAISSSPAVSGGMVFFGGEDGVLYGLGAGPEAPVTDALPKEQMAERAFPGRELKGAEWRSPGGDMGYSAVSTDTQLKPPFKIKWRTRVWDSAKGPVIVAAGTVFQTGRTGGLAALDAQTGEVVWRTRHTDQIVESRPAAVYSEGKVLVQRGSYDMYPGAPSGGNGIWCHDARSGEVLWHKPFQVAYHFNPDGLVAGDGKVLACLPDEKGTLQAVALSLKDGSEVWRQSLGLAAGKKGRRFAAAAGDGVWLLSVADGRTFGLAPADGKVLWKTDKDLAITMRTRLASRKGLVVVFNGQGAHALDAKTGAPRWTGRGVVSMNSNSSEYSAQPLTDLYLESQGQKGVFDSTVCSYPVFANGVWYVHTAHSNILLARDREAPTGAGRRDTEGVLWKRLFLSNACPPVSPAYGRLYYTPCGEGVVYCFENDAAPPGAEKQGGPG